MYMSNLAKNVFRYSVPRKKMEERKEGEGKDGRREHRVGQI